MEEPNSATPTTSAIPQSELPKVADADRVPQSTGWIARRAHDQCIRRRHGAHHAGILHREGLDLAGIVLRWTEKLQLKIVPEEARP